MTHKTLIVLQFKLLSRQNPFNSSFFDAHIRCNIVVYEECKNQHSPIYLSILVYFDRTASGTKTIINNYFNKKHDKFKQKQTIYFCQRISEMVAIFRDQIITISSKFFSKQ